MLTDRQTDKKNMFFLYNIDVGATTIANPGITF